MWNKSQAKQFLRETMAEWGPGWSKLSADLRVVCIEAKVLTVARMQGLGGFETVPVAALDALRLEMLRFAYLYDDETGEE